MRHHPAFALGLITLTGWMFVSCDRATPEADEQENLKSLIEGINHGHPKREQAIKDLQPFLKSSDPKVRVNAVEMLYAMKDRSGYETLREILRRPDPNIATLQVRAAEIFAKYREHRAGDMILIQYEKTKSVELKPPALTLRLQGMVPHLHESLKQRMWVDSIEGLAVLEPQNNLPLFKRLADNDQVDPEVRAAAIFGLAMAGSEAGMVRLIAVATNGKEALPGNHEDIWVAQGNAVKYLTYFRGERVIKLFESMISPKASGSHVALAYLRYHYPKNQIARNAVIAGLQPGGGRLGWDFTLIMQLARLSGDPELLDLGHKADYFTALYELDVRAGWSHARLGEYYLPDWEGDWEQPVPGN